MRGYREILESIRDGQWWLVPKDWREAADWALGTIQLQSMEINSLRNSHTKLETICKTLRQENEKLRQKIYEDGKRFKNILGAAGAALKE